MSVCTNFLGLHQTPGSQEETLVSEGRRDGANFPCNHLIWTNCTWAESLVSMKCFSKISFPHEQLKMMVTMNAGITWADKRCKMWRYRICFSSKWTPSAALTALNGWSSMQTPQPFAIFKWQHFKSPQYGNLWQGPWWTGICAKSSFLIRKQMWMASLRTADVKIPKFVHRYTLIVWWLCSCLFAFSILKNTD